MISALISFLGGSVFRMLWGEISSWLTSRQEHQHEIERMELQERVDAAQHARNLEAQRLQAELGIKVIQVKGESAVSELEAGAWLKAVEGTAKAVGVKFVDAWNAVIRPFVATWAIVMVTAHFARNGWVLDENGWQLCGAALGIYLADRALFKRGK